MGGRVFSPAETETHDHRDFGLRPSLVGHLPCGLVSASACGSQAGRWQPADVVLTSVHDDNDEGGQSAASKVDVETSTPTRSRIPRSEQRLQFYVIVIRIEDQGINTAKNNTENYRETLCTKHLKNFLNAVK